MQFPPTPYQLPVLTLFSFSRLIPDTLNRFIPLSFHIHKKELPLLVAQ